MEGSPYTSLIVERRERVALVRLNRPQALNALNAQLMDELIDALQTLDRDEQVLCIVLTGNERAFAAGADIKEMAEASIVDIAKRESFWHWERLRKIKKPLIAAVNGYALGGGCELAMLCDMIIAGESAKFGQPEINLGIIPGAGGTQRLPRAIGKAKAMEWVLTGRFYSAAEAERAGLVTRVVPDEAVVDEALKLAAEIAAKPPLAVRMAKDAVLAAFDTTLETGLAYERHHFYLLFGTEDQKEGMAAFIAKRQPQWRGR
ncbi:MAG TPA: enoyl-CoA hydratase-related protein [Bacillota bacterium]